MTLPVPLSVRVGDRHITQQVQSLSFRKEAIGGCRSISFSLARSLTDLSGLTPFAKVTVGDVRTGSAVADGRYSDPGRGTGAEGQRWDCVAFGPAQHASDLSQSLVYLDSSTGGWVFDRSDLAGAGATFSPGAAPDTGGGQGLIATWQDGTAIVTNSATTIRYARIWQAGQKLARVAFNWVTGATGSDFKIETIFSTDGNWSSVEASTDNWSTLGGTRSNVVVANFANGRNTVDIRTRWNGGATTISGSTTWAYTTPPQVEALRLDKSGAEVTAGYTGTAYPHQIVADLLGRILPQMDGANAIIDTASTYPITQLSYPDGATAAQVLDDLMALVPAYRWYTHPSASAGVGYGFEWSLWPTTVRYEATLQDGGSFPLSTQGVYNQVRVKWTDAAGRTMWTSRSMACEVLDSQGLTRRATIDLGSEAGTSGQAETAGDNFLIEHNVPKNQGTLTVARAIRDVITGALVQPWEIEPGELVRVLGVEAYPDSFNSSTNDGQGVFRIFAVDYTTEGNAATLALDSDPKTTEDALVKLLKQRTRK